MTQRAERLERSLGRARARAAELERRALTGNERERVGPARSFRSRHEPSGFQRARRSPSLIVFAALAILGIGTVLIDSDEAAAPLPSAGLLAVEEPLAADVSEEALEDIPSRYLHLYKAAAERYGVDWAVIAAVGKVESDHGRIPLPGVERGRNTAGAAGPMQFTAESWLAYGIDADGEGQIAPHDPEDAIFATASYLRASGAAVALRRAVLTYNPDPAYARSVLAIADQYRES